MPRTLENFTKHYQTWERKVSLNLFAPHPRANDLEEKQRLCPQNRAKAMRNFAPDLPSHLTVRTTTPWFSPRSDRPQMRPQIVRILPAGICCVIVRAREYLVPALLKNIDATTFRSIGLMQYSKGNLLVFASGQPFFDHFCQFMFLFWIAIMLIVSC